MRSATLPPAPADAPRSIRATRACRALHGGTRTRLAALVLAVALGGGARAQESGLQRAVRLVGELRHAEALEAARSDEDPLRRQQALTYVLDQSGDLAGALRAAREGLETAPRDLWLLERALLCALALHRAELATTLAERWNAAIAASSAPEVELDAQASRASALAVEVQRLARTARRQERALARARWTAGTLLVVLVAALALAARGTARPDA